jgi:hypothetical protein
MTFKQSIIDKLSQFESDAVSNLNYLETNIKYMYVIFMILRRKMCCPYRQQENWQKNCYIVVEKQQRLVVILHTLSLTHYNLSVERNFVCSTPLNSPPANWAVQLLYHLSTTIFKIMNK